MYCVYNYTYIYYKIILKGDYITHLCSTRDNQQVNLLGAKWKSVCIHEAHKKA